VSEDGIRWLPFKPLAVDFPNEVKLGVTAINTSSEPFKAEFSEAAVFKKETVRASR
jgi:hypothetical protein